MKGNNSMNEEKLFYNGKCVMSVDMDCIEDDRINEYLEEIVGVFQERAFEEFNFTNKVETEIKKIWIGHENIYELKNQIERKLEQEYEDNPFEKLEQLFKIMEENLGDEEFKIFKKLRNEEVSFYNNFEQDFYENGGSSDYVWIERNGRKYNSF